jgi:predicted nucleic acid-binding protein
MTAVVVDTCVVSFLLREGDTRAELYRPHLAVDTKIISFMTLAELYRWADERDWGERRRADLEHDLSNYVVYGVTRTLCRKWAETTDQARRRGHPIDVDDAWIAATALLYNFPLVSNNRRHYEHIPELELLTEA